MQRAWATDIGASTLSISRWLRLQKCEVSAIREIYGQTKVKEEDMGSMSGYVSPMFMERRKEGEGEEKKKIWDESRRLNSGRETSTSRKIFKIKYPKLNLWSTVHGEANWRIRSSGISGQKKRDHQMLVAAQKSAVNKKVYHSSFVKHTLLCCWQKKTNKHRTKARE